jgi:hypothetical protein
VTGNEQQRQGGRSATAEPLALPGWGTPFPPEQPRRDVDHVPGQGLPTAASVAAAATVGEEAEADFTHEDRRPLDRRRRKARGIDNLLLLPVAFGVVQLTQGVTIAAGVLVLAIEMSYFFVLETLQGQTLGKRVAKLRVVHPDGSAASAGKIALRTLLRPIDYTLVGIVTVLASGKRRRRLGDMAANTIVRDDNRSFKRAPESPLLVVFPVLCIGAAVAAMIALQPTDPMLAKRSSHPYMAKIDRICEKQWRQANALEASGRLDLASGQVLFRQQTRKIEKLPSPPAEVRADVKRVVRYHRQVDRLFARLGREMNRAVDPGAVAAQRAPVMEGLLTTASRRYEQMGLPYCAAGASSG